MTTTDAGSRTVGIEPNRPHAAMPACSAISELIDATPWIDVHEHLVEERHRLGDGAYEFIDNAGYETRIPADWAALVIGGYALHDFATAGVPACALDAFQNDELGPIDKWDLIAPVIDHVKSTGYMRAIDISVERLFGERLTRGSCEEIDRACRDLRRAGYYRHVLRDVANVEYCHVNSADVDPFCETDSADLLRQDLSVLGLVQGAHPRAERLSGIEVGTLEDYLDVIDWVFAQYAQRAVAIKCQWAYLRPLAVGEVDAPPRRAFGRLRANAADAADRRTVQDFLFQRCLVRAAQASLPVKLHMGSLAVNNNRQLAHVFDCVADVAPLVQANPRNTFVLMHMAWPQQEQLLALAKHQPNVIVEMSWAWTLAPRSASEFLQRFLTTVPASKLLCFGGDYLTVENVVGHAQLARRGLQKALDALVQDDWLTIDHALGLIPELMRGNAARVFSDDVGAGA